MPTETVTETTVVEPVREAAALPDVPAVVEDPEPVAWAPLQPSAPEPEPPAPAPVAKEPVTPPPAGGFVQVETVSAPVDEADARNG